VYRRPEDRTLLLERLHAQGEVREYEVEFVRRDGSCVWVTVNLRLVHDAQGREFFDGTIEDISGRKAAEAALIESEERFRSYVHGAPDGIFVTDDRGRYLDCNPAACEMTGYSRDELLAMGVAELSGPTMGEAGLERFREMVEHGQVHDEIMLRRKDGGDVVCQLDAVSLGDGRFIGFCKDVSDRKRAEEEVRAAAVRTQRTLEGTVAAMGALIETRDPYTAGHERRVTELAGAIAGRLGMDDERVGALRMAGEVHDIGKISVPAEILSKPGRLTDNEYDLVRQHPRTGYGILSAVDFRWPVAEIVLQHHERLDGSGYPQGLEGEAIAPEARVLAVADVVEAMSSHRPYRPALGLDAALDEVEQGRGSLYDADAVDACVALFREEGFTFSD
jgi:PAS domain S-box-containing protein